VKRLAYVCSNMGSSRALIFGFVITLLFTTVACGEKQADSTSIDLSSTTADTPRLDAFERLSEQLQQRVDNGLIPNAQVLVSQNGELLFKRRFGYQDVEKGTRLPEDAIYRFYSMSKPITSVAIMMLVEQGLLSLDDTAEKFIPAFKNTQVYIDGPYDDMQTVAQTRPFTIRDLLAHRSGITYHFIGDTAVHEYYRKHGVKRYTPVGNRAGDAPAAKSLSELIDRIANAPLLHQPGEYFAYSYSTTVLGHIIEKVSGETLDEFLEKNIFEPLAMHNSGFFVKGERLDRFVTHYVMSAEGLRAIETPENTDYKDDNRLLDGGGAMAGTGEDYLKFATMLANGGELNGVRILSRDSVMSMFEPQIKTQDIDFLSGINFGLGFALGDSSTEELGLRPARTFGWAGSANTNFWVDPDKGFAMVLMTQVIMSPDVVKKTKLRKIVNDAIVSYRQSETH